MQIFSCIQISSNLENQNMLAHMDTWLSKVDEMMRKYIFTCSSLHYIWLINKLTVNGTKSSEALQSANILCKIWMTPWIWRTPSEWPPPNDPLNLSDPSKWPLNLNNPPLNNPSKWPQNLNDPFWMTPRSASSVVEVKCLSACLTYQNNTLCVIYS